MIFIIVYLSIIRVIASLLCFGKSFFLSCSISSEALNSTVECFFSYWIHLVTVFQRPSPRGPVGLPGPAGPPGKDGIDVSEMPHLLGGLGTDVAVKAIGDANVSQ